MKGKPRKSKLDLTTDEQRFARFNNFHNEYVKEHPEENLKSPKPLQLFSSEGTSIEKPKKELSSFKSETTTVEPKTPKPLQLVSNTDSTSIENP
jgi:hypothetical protein